MAGDVPFATHPLNPMSKIVGWLGAALFIVIVLAIVFRVGKLKQLVTGQAPAA